MIPSHPYWNLKPGAWTSFYRSTIQAKYFPDTMDLQLTSPAQMINDGSANPQRRTMVEIRDSCYPTAAMIWQNGAHICPSDWDQWCNSLYTTLWDNGTDQRWLGESGGMQIGWFGDKAWSSVGFPPEPQLPVNIDDYRTPITGTTKGYSFNRATGQFQAASLDWKFKNWGRGPGPNESWEWGNVYPFQVRCVLEERPGTRTAGNNVFVYDFCKGIGPICMWQGEVQPDLAIKDGLMWQVAGYG